MSTTREDVLKEVSRINGEARDVVNYLSSGIERIEAHLCLLIDKVNRIEDWIDERTPPDPPQPEGVLYCHMVKKDVGHGRGCSCTTETGCGYYGDRSHGYT